MRKRVTKASSQKQPERGSRGSYLPPAKKGAILAGAVQGKSQRQIAREVGCDRGTVVRILSAPEIAAALEQESSNMVTRVKKAGQVYDDHLEAGNLQAARDIMVGLQVCQSRHPRSSQLPRK